MKRRLHRAALSLMLAVTTSGCAAGNDQHTLAGADAHPGHDTPHGADQPPEHAGVHAVHEAGHGHGLRTDHTVIRMRHDEAARVLTIELGPIPLPAGTGGHVMPVTPLLSAAMPLAAHLTRFEVELVDGSGRGMPQEVLHHVNVMLPGRRDLFRPIMQRLVAAGEETDPIGLPWPLGFPVEKGEQLLTYAMLHNDGDIDYGDVTLRLHFSYTTERTRMAVQPLFIDASPPPGPASWDLPPGRSERSWEGSPSVSGRILGLGGHLHRYGTALILEDLTAGRVIFRTEPELDGTGNVVAMPQQRFIARFGVPVRSDHIYRITAVYDNPTGRTIRGGAMGSIGGVIRVRRNQWPAADTTHPLYREDLAILAGAHH